MPKRITVILAVLVAGALRSAAQVPSSLDIANLQEDVRGLSQKVNDLSLRIEQIERQLQTSANGTGVTQNYATVVQLNAAVADLNHSVQVALVSSQSDTLAQVDQELQKLEKQVNAALAAAGKGPAATSFGTDYPKTGISYTIVRGDTIALIAKKTGAKTQDIINANKISDPARIQAGQTLFIPGGK